MDLLGKLEACDHHDAVRVLLLELGRRPKRALAALLHPDKHGGAPFFEACMKALNCAADLVEELGAPEALARVKREANVRNNEACRREAYGRNNPGRTF